MGKESDAPKLQGTYFKFLLEKPPVDFLVPDPGPVANGSKLPYVLMHMPKPGQTQVVVPEPTTAVDVADTPMDAPSTGTFGAASEATMERPESPQEVSGLIERLGNLLGVASNSNGGIGGGDGGALETLVDRVQALKTEGNQHFSAGEHSPALLLYSEAIDMLEGAGEDAALATILCNRSVTYLKLGRLGSALTDAERARALGGGKAHVRLAEALSSLGRYEEALEAFEVALAHAVSDCAASTLCSRECLVPPARVRGRNRSRTLNLTASWQEGANQRRVRERIAEVIPQPILVERALVIKTEGNQHFSSDDYSRALPLYSEAIEMLEGAGEDTALATILCTRSAAYLKLGRSASALTDADRARALGGDKAHFRRAEALSSLRRYEEALEAYAAALENAVSDCAASTLLSLTMLVAPGCRNHARTLNLTASWQEGAKKREVRKRIAEVKHGRVLQEVWENVKAAQVALDWRGVLKWEGRMDELLEYQAEDADRDSVLGAFLDAHMGAFASGCSQTDHALSILGIQKRRIELLGKIQRFRDQGEAICVVAGTLQTLGRQKEASPFYQRARDVGEAHGFFSVESRACLGLGLGAIKDGRSEEGVELLQNALVCPTPFTLHPRL